MLEEIKIIQDKANSLEEMLETQINAIHNVSRMAYEAGYQQGQKDLEAKQQNDEQIT